MPDPQPDDDAGRLKALEKRIRDAQGTPQQVPHTDKGYSQGSLAWRMVVELVAGLVIGFCIGYGLDILFGTMPLFLVLFIFLGLAAGVNVMLRSARELQAKTPPGEDGGEGS
ncbi:AtpZ/AtpI family protein [Pseudoroseicyclus aestuarii]|uniref:ATP synthase protein I n=1 Tax=Pseudoroseicyclus aestuarii TaxID=1795041 RepID=A0A318T0U4_9RHOB|nr:AtpZ/AtpI family protein [Pseudoroseicyclus aestuarii]PYE83804.1 ATP synthase protein I [Pseudoroseicyclus aestuarii]